MAGRADFALKSQLGEPEEWGDHSHYKNVDASVLVEREPGNLSQYLNLILTFDVASWWYIAACVLALSVLMYATNLVGQPQAGLGPLVSQSNIFVLLSQIVPDG